MLAQTPTGSLVGTIVGPERRSYSGCDRYHSRCIDRHKPVDNNVASRAYEFTNLHPSTYEVTAEAKGFSKALERNVNVAVGDVAYKSQNAGRRPRRL